MQNSQNQNKHQLLAYITFNLNSAIHQYPIYQGDNIIGRDPLKAAIPLQERSISSRHCKLYFKNNKLYVMDLKSKNGVFINNHNNQISPHQQYQINPETDKLFFAEIQCKIILANKKQQSKNKSNNSKKKDEQMLAQLSDKNLPIQNIHNKNKKQNIKQNNKKMQYQRKLKVSNQDQDVFTTILLMKNKNDNNDKKNNQKKEDKQEARQNNFNRKQQQQNNLDMQIKKPQKQKKKSHPKKHSKKQQSKQNQMKEENKKNQQQSSNYLIRIHQYKEKNQQNKSQKQQELSASSKKIKQCDDENDEQYNKNLDKKQNKKISKNSRLVQHSLPQKKANNLSKKEDKRKHSYDTKPKKKKESKKQSKDNKRAPNNAQLEIRRSQRLIQQIRVMYTCFRPAFTPIPSIIIVEDVKKDFDILLVGDEYKRTVKFYMAILKGIPIIEHEWIIRCQNARRIFPYQKYQVIQNRDIIRKSLQKVRKGFKIFQGYFFHFVKLYQPNPKFHLAKENIILLVQKGEGKIMNSIGRSKDSHFKCILPREPTQQDINKCKKITSQVYTIDMVLDSIFYQEMMDNQKYRL